MCKRLALAGAIGLGLVLPARAGNLPERVGTCVATTISRLGQRLEDGATHQPIPGSGSAVSFANGGDQVGYEEVPAIQHARVGDRVFMCLMRIPGPCPPHDKRGRVYTTTDLRTLESWTLPDAEHSCGGA